MTYQELFEQLQINNAKTSGFFTVDQLRSMAASASVELEKPQGHGIPHAFVSISGSDLSRPVVVGYYPQIHGMSGPGTVKNDGFKAMRFFAARA